MQESGHMILRIIDWRQPHLGLSTKFNTFFKRATPYICETQKLRTSLI